MDAQRPDNHLLSGLDPPTLAALRSRLHRVRTTHGDTLHRAGEEIAFAYFPISGVLSVMATTRDGRTAETAMVGREGMVGLSLAYGVKTSFASVVVQVSGEAWRIAAAEFRAICDGSQQLRDVLARFGLFMLAQSQQATVCQAMHSVERRTARWLEQCRMRLGSVDIPMTQEFLAQMLGVQRTTISLTEKTMVNAGLISIGRGAIRIEDGDRLASAACECLTRIEERYVEMLGTYR